MGWHATWGKGNKILFPLVLELYPSLLVTCTRYNTNQSACLFQHSLELCLCDISSASSSVPVLIDNNQFSIIWISYIVRLRVRSHIVLVIVHVLYNHLIIWIHETEDCHIDYTITWDCKFRRLTPQIGSFIFHRLSLISQKGICSFSRV